MPQLDVSTFPPQLVWLLITFGALFLIVWKVALPRIVDVRDNRQRRIEDDLACRHRQTTLVARPRP